MKKYPIKIFIVILLTILLYAYSSVCFAAETDQKKEGGDFASDLKKDPKSAFADNPEKAWETLQANPTLLSQQSILDAAFADTNNAAKAAGLINANPELLSSSNVLEKFDREIRAQAGIALLKSNPVAQKSWLEKKFRITDKGAEILAYDGRTIKTGGEKGTVFAAKDFPEARVLQDGSLVLRTGDKFSLSSSLYVANGKIHMEKGEADLSLARKDIAVNDGIVRQKSLTGEIKYQGSFELSQDVTGTKASGTQPFLREAITFGKSREPKSSKMWITGTAISPSGANERDIIFVGDANAKFSMSELSIKSSSMVYFADSNEAFCRAGYSCINKKGTGFFKFSSIENNDDITFKTPLFFQSVEAGNVNNGKFKFISLNENKKEESGIEFSSRDKKAKLTGKLSETNAGRFDIYFSDSNKIMRSHWSSTEFMTDEVSAFFSQLRKGKSSFVTCEADSCEKAFAESFGTIIYPPGKKSADIAEGKWNPTTTIILAGDYASTTRSLNAFCETEGCYILNSRDSPQTTTSTNLVVTGHHYGGDDKIWRKSQTYGFWADAFSFSDLPEGPVETITFSSCNTVTAPILEGQIYAGMHDLIQKYNPKIIQGWEGTAPASEMISEPATLGAAYPTEGGRRTWYVYAEKPDPPRIAEKGWYWTDGEIYKRISLV